MRNHLWFLIAVYSINFSISKEERGFVVFAELGYHCLFRDWIASEILASMSWYVSGIVVVVRRVVNWLEIQLQNIVLFAELVRQKIRI